MLLELSASAEMKLRNKTLIVFSLKIPAWKQEPMPHLLAIAIFFCITIYICLRIFDAMRQGEVSYRSNYELETHYYKRSTNPYMFWQTIVMFGLGAIASFVVFALLAMGKI